MVHQDTFDKIYDLLYDTDQLTMFEANNTAVDICKLINERFNNPYTMSHEFGSEPTYKRYYCEEDFEDDKENIIRIIKGDSIISMTRDEFFEEFFFNN